MIANQVVSTRSVESEAQPLLSASSRVMYGRGILRGETKKNLLIQGNLSWALGRS